MASNQENRDAGCKAEYTGEDKMSLPLIEPNIMPVQVWQRAKQRPTQFNSNKNKPGVDYKEVAWAPPVVDTKEDNNEPQTA